uniref:Heterokaryon incompatibility domain-containing protein n=1 Tax=Bionectria ochroleuca TaxID=29856 RepID=A0A8H7TPV5_BIOOC
MKKFTQILTRRITRSTTPDYESAAPFESNCFHQLTSTRLAKGDSFKRPAPRAGSSRILADDAHFDDICWTCKGIDFPKVLDWQPGDRRPWIPLAHTLSPEFPDCPYCSFFRQLIGFDPGADGSSKFTPYLRIRQAFERLGVKEKHELGGAVIFEVTTKNKSLLEGYIIKMADDEVDLAAYESCPRRPELRGRTVTSLVDAALPKTWIDFCKDNHTTGDCVRSEPPLEGLRLIDCETNKVVCVDDLDSASLEYVTLSTSLGNGGRELLEEDVLENDVPLLFKDAIQITTSLGFQYLWASQICLAKLEETERQKQLDLTGEIFAQSALTIVVAADIGLNDGIPGISTPREPQLSLKTQDTVFTTSLLRPDLDVSGSRWASGGWSFQEGLLSRRRLVFTPSQIYFQCRTLHCHETLSLPLQYAPGLNLGRIFPDGGAGTRPEVLSKQIQTYLTKDFEFPEDRLKAFQGVLRHYSKIPRGMNNFLGLPLFNVDDFAQEPVANRTSQLAVALGWTPERVSPSPYLDPLILSHEGHYPSWTWLSWYPRPGHSQSNQTFRFNLVEESKARPLDGVSAPSKMKISVGFEGGKVLSWEDDETALSNEVEPIKFLRLSTFCVDIRLTKDEENLIIIGLGVNPQAKDAIKGWLRSSHSSLTSLASPDSSTTSDADSLPNGEHKLTGILLSGRGWRGPAKKTATLLICGPKRLGSEEERLVRLGLLSITYADFVSTDDKTAKLEGVVLNDVGGKGDIDLRMREVDLY